MKCLWEENVYKEFCGFNENWMEQFMGFLTRVIEGKVFHWNRERGKCVRNKKGKIEKGSYNKYIENINYNRKL